MRILSPLFIVFLLGASQAYAADNAVVLTPGSGVAMRSVDVGSGVQSSTVILGGSTGAAIYGTAGSSNANVLSVQGIASGTNLPASLAAETTKVIGTVPVGALLDGADVTQGAKADAACANGSSACSVNARLAHLENLLAGPQSPTSTVTGSLTPVVCGSAVSSCVLANSAGHNLYSVYAECSAACWLMVFNATSAPSNGATTAGTASGNMRECVAIPIHDQRTISYTIFPDNYSVGITAAISSTECASLTLATTGFIKGMIQ